MALIPLPASTHSIQGKWIGLSPQRRFVTDLLHFAKKVPSVPSQRRMRLADVVAARGAQAEHVSWVAIFVKAYSIVSATRPELRRAYLPFLWPHLYEHPINVASFSLERTYRGEPGVFFTQVPRPEQMSLAELNALVRHHKKRADRERSQLHPLALAQSLAAAAAALHLVAGTVHRRRLSCALFRHVRH